MGILDKLFKKKKEADNSHQGTSNRQFSKPDSVATPPQTVFIPEKEAGAIFTFNLRQALRTQFNPQRYFCQSILRAFCPREGDCPRHIQEAFYELRVSPIDLSTWGRLFYYTRIGNYYIRPGVGKSEQDFVTSDFEEDISELGFTPYIIAIWSSVPSGFAHIHNWLERNNIEGYVGYKTLDIVGTIEKFHEMCQDVDLGWDAIVKDKKYLYPRGSDHPLQPEVMSEMGFSRAES